MKLQKLFLILCAAFSFNSCRGHLPPITSCIWDQPRAQFHCVDAKDQAFDLDYTDPKSDKLIAIPFSDFGTLLDYCKNKKN